MNQTILPNLILYLVQAIREAGGQPGITRLVKLLYLIDVEFYRRRQRTVTGLEWVFYKYGPYAFEIESVLDSLGMDLTEQDHSISGGRTFRSFTSTGSDIGIDAIGGRPVQIVADSSVEIWGLENLNKLLSFVYFQTEPMIDAQVGMPLDFSTITARGRERRLNEDMLKLSDAEAEQIIPKLKALASKRHSEMLESQRRIADLTSRPDHAEDEALGILKDQESGIPTLDISVETEPS